MKAKPKRNAMAKEKATLSPTLNLSQEHAAIQVPGMGKPPPA